MNVVFVSGETNNENNGNLLLCIYLITWQPASYVGLFAPSLSCKPHFDIRNLWNQPDAFHGFAELSKDMVRYNKILFEETKLKEEMKQIKMKWSYNLEYETIIFSP